MKNEKLKMENAAPAAGILFTFFILNFALLLSSCGFHLRGTESASWPESLSRLRVVVRDSKLANDPLLVAVKGELQTDPKATLTEETDAPTLELFGERAESQVLSVGSTGRVSGYRLKYEASFRLTDSKGLDLLAPQTVRAIRDYTYDPLKVLAKDQEEQDLKRTLRRDVVQQILRRLSRAPMQNEK